jgi:pseudoazurin
MASAMITARNGRLDGNADWVKSTCKCQNRQKMGKDRGSSLFLFPGARCDLWSLHNMIRTIAAAAITLALSTASVFAADFEVKMLNKGTDGTAMVFEPNFVKIAPGDTVKFIPTDKGHFAVAMKGAIPEGAEEFKTKLNEELDVTLTTEGVYMVKCTPHYPMGMVMAIQVGAPANLDAIKAFKLNPKSAERMAPVFAAIAP